MKLLYITEQELNNASGISNKVRSQVEIWKSLGHEVDVLDFNSMEFIRTHYVVKLKGYNLQSIKTLDTFLKLWNNFYIISKIVQSQKYDVVYSRFTPWSIGHSQIAKNSKYIIEVNSDELTESKKRSKLTYLYWKVTKKHHFKIASGFVSVSNELADRNKRLNQTYAVISNGYAGQAQITANNSGKIKLVFIGTNQPWHGYDKLLRLMKQMPDFEFHIIGSFPATDLENVINHGVLKNSDAINVIRNCDVGISSLALHRAGIKEASPLKSREYMAFGLPMIIAYKDSDLSNEDFILNIGNTEKNVDEHFNQIEAFSRNAKNNFPLRQKVASSFESKMTMQKKEEQRLSFFEKVMKQNPKISHS